MNPIIKILMDRDDMCYAEAQIALRDARRQVELGEDPEEVLLNEFGLEPDYLLDLLGV